MSSFPKSSLPTLYLASKSPRRAQLLESLGLAFEILALDTVEKDPTFKNVDEITRENALVKATRASEHLTQDNVVVIGADTLVVLGQEVIGKPKSPQDVKKILRKFSEKKQTVVTGLALFSKKYGCRQCNVKTDIFFRRLEEKEIEEYTLTKEPYDKAGGYAVQGLGSLFIEKMEGSYTNAMGLPIEKLLEELGAFTKIPAYQWFLKGE